MSNPSVDHDADFEALLAYLKRTRGFDFTAYKRASLMRRLQKRMQAVNIESYGAYTDYLEVHPDEFAQLFDTILINVTNFFRDPAAWAQISSDILPRILAAKRPDEQIRVWSAGCASGEEAYTIAMLLAEALGVDQFHERVKIYASDVDDAALNRARLATYTARDVAAVAPELVDKYFDQIDQRFVIRKDLRRGVIYGRHDLVQDAPISRIDLLICRNALMYFNAEAQTRILSRFHFGLNDNGFLFLGKAEMLFTHASLFTPVDIKRRVFAKVPRLGYRERLMNMAQSTPSEGADQASKRTQFREAAFDGSPVAQVVVDRHGFLVLTNKRARTLLGLNAEHIGQTVHDLDFSYRVPELKTRLEAVFQERRPSIIQEIEWMTSSGDLHILEVQLSPLMDGKNALIGANIAFTDITRDKRLQEEIEHTSQELETTLEELQSTNEELETTNEELQSTVEELETTNEELQSTNEELETMNEELQSTNQELQTLNDELRRRSDDLNLVNAYLESILRTIGGAVIVLDRNLSVQIWNQDAEDSWGLRADEVQDKNFLNLDIGLPVDQLKQPIRDCLNGESDYHEIVLDAVNHRGKSIQCKVSLTPLIGARGDGIRGAILALEDVES